MSCHGQVINSQELQGGPRRLCASLRHLQLWPTVALLSLVKTLHKTSNAKDHFYTKQCTILEEYITCTPPTPFGAIVITFPPFHSLNGEMPGVQRTGAAARTTILSAWVKGQELQLALDPV